MKGGGGRRRGERAPTLNHTGGDGAWVPWSRPGLNLLPSPRLAGNLGDNVKLTREKAKITVSSELAMSKR